VSLALSEVNFRLKEENFQSRSMMHNNENKRKEHFHVALGSAFNATYVAY
jgi:hypothetical protein